MGGLVLGIAPVFVLIALGYGLRKSDFLPDAAWRPIEKLSINILYPGFLIPAIWHADLSGPSAGAAGGAAAPTSPTGNRNDAARGSGGSRRGPPPLPGRGAEPRARTRELEHDPPR